MSELHYFSSGYSATAVDLPFTLDAVLDDWCELRKRMVKAVPPQFSRDEWAYLVTFLHRDNLHAAFEQAFGLRSAAPTGGVQMLARPKRTVAVWLPNNVSLLGPCVLVLLSLTGVEVLMKGGSRTEDLSAAFLDYCRRNLSPGATRDHLVHRVSFEVFGRDDERNAAWASRADVRLVFGGDEAAAAVGGLPAPVESMGFAFVDRHSEAWIEAGADDDACLDTLIKVAAIFGQAGCTSPRRVVLLDADDSGAAHLRDRLAERWTRVVPGRPPMHVASSSILSAQCAAALGWSVARVPDNVAVLASGAPDLGRFPAAVGLPIVAASRERAFDSLPPHVQTIGHALRSTPDDEWLRLLAASRVRRFVPISQMHHFSSIWDGAPFWAEVFERVPVTR